MHLDVTLKISLIIIKVYLVLKKSSFNVFLVSVLLSVGIGEVGTDLVTGEERTGVVSTKYGKVEGFITRVDRDAAINKFVKVFLGVPYASPPTGNYR